MSARIIRKLYEDARLVRFAVRLYELKCDPSGLC